MLTISFGLLLTCAVATVVLAYLYHSVYGGVDGNLLTSEDRVSKLIGAVIIGLLATATFVSLVFFLCSRC